MAKVLCESENIISYIIHSLYVLSPPEREWIEEKLLFNQYEEQSGEDTIKGLVLSICLMKLGLIEDYPSTADILSIIRENNKNDPLLTSLLYEIDKEYELKSRL